MAYSVQPIQTQILSSIKTYSANVTSYDAVNKIVYLDNPVAVSLGYNSALGQIGSQYNINGTVTSVALAVNQGVAPPQLSTDEAGNFIGIFNVPSSSFQTGTRVFRVDNRNVATDPTTATCYAEATFTASGLASTVQSQEFSPSVDSSATTFTQASQQSVSTIQTINIRNPRDPIAQSFIIDKSNYPNGAFLNSLKLFFATKPASNVPITVSIVPTVNGIPSGQALDYSTVTLTAQNVLTSSSPHYLDPTTFTEFMFDAPVYIQAGSLYAFIIQSSSPDYTLYLAEQNQIAIPSTAKTLPTDANPSEPTKVGSAPYVGSLFESQNAITWTPDQTKDLMFVIDQCVFNTSISPQIPFNLGQGLPFRKLGRHDMQYFLDPTNVSNLYGNFGTDMVSDAYNITTTDFVPTSTSVNYAYSATLANGNQPVGPYPVTPGKFGSPTPDNIYLSDGQGERILLTDSSQSFSLAATLSSTDPNVSPIISDDAVSLYNIRYIINNMGIQNNVISIVNTGTGYLSGGNGTYYSSNSQQMFVSAPDDTVNGTQAVMQATILNGNVTSVYVTTPGSGYLTNPTVSIYTANTTPAVVQIQGETGTTGGNSYAKYFTKPVILNAGNDSGDLRVYYTAYKPTGTNVYVYYKILSRSDTQTFAQSQWQLMTQTTPVAFSTNTQDLIEFECAPGIFSSGSANNYVSYVSSNGQTYNSFYQFAIKVVLATNDKTNVPFLTDIRAIALPPGTNV